MNLGIAFADQGDLEGALSEFSLAVHLAPNDSAPHYNRGRVLFDLGRLDEAKPELETAIATDSRIGDAFYLLGMIERRAGNPDGAISRFKQAIEIMPENAPAFYELGLSLQEKGNSAGAEESWRKAIEISPDYFEAYYSLVRALAKTDPAGSRELTSRMNELQKQFLITDRAETLGNWAMQSASARDWPKAIEQMREGIKVCGECNALPLFRKNLGLIYCRAGDWKNGLAELLEAQKALPNDLDIARTIEMARNALK
jgi:tetratricopeptide (TPR) repeat protein